jgi:hypothetical protein
MLAAGAYLEQSVARLYAGRDGSQSVYKAAELIQTFQQQYATLRTRYFDDEIRRWRPDSFTSLAQRCPGIRQRLLGPWASAPAFFAHLNAAMAQVTAIVTNPQIPIHARGEAVYRLVQAGDLV